MNLTTALRLQPCATMFGCVCECWGLNPGPHAYVANTLLAELSAQASVSLKDCIFFSQLNSVDLLGPPLVTGSFAIEVDTGVLF